MRRRQCGGRLSNEEAADILGVSPRTFQRWQNRYEEQGLDGIADKRLGRSAHNMAPVDEVTEMLTLFDTRYLDFNTRHFFEKLRDNHDFSRSDNWVRLNLQRHGRIKAAPRRGPIVANVRASR